LWYTTVAVAAVLSVLGDACSGPINLFSDDAYYYLIPARNFVSLGFFSFDGVHLTNGYHPLWMWVLVAVYAVLPADASPAQQVVAVKFLQIAIVLSTIGSAAFMARSLYSRGSAYAYGFAGVILILIYPDSSGHFRAGMETTLATGIAVWLYYALVEDRRWAVSLLLPLLFLARLDLLVYVAGPVALYFLLRRDLAWSERIGPLAPITAVAATFMLYNYALHGWVAPISGVLKSSFPWPTPHPSFLSDPILYAWQSARGIKFFSQPNLTSITALSALAAGVLVVRGRRQSGGYRLVDLLVAAVPLSLVAGVVLFQKWNKGVAVWYLSVPMVTGAFASMLALGRLLEPARAASRAIAPGVVVLLLFFSAVHVLYLPRTLRTEHSEHQSGLYAFLRDGVAPDAVLAGTDVGRTAFWSGRRTVNLDGLINSYDYQDYLRNGQLAEYLDQEGVTHLVLAVTAYSPRYVLRDVDRMYEHRINPAAVHGRDYELDFYVYSYMYDTYSDRIRLSAEREVYRGELQYNSQLETRWLVLDVRGLSASGARER
jgi:hypothetical protein